MPGVKLGPGERKSAQVKGWTPINRMPVGADITIGFEVPKKAGFLDAHWVLARALEAPSVAHGSRYVPRLTAEGVFVEFRLVTLS
jgi:hypothetical protein